MAPGLLILYPPNVLSQDRILQQIHQVAGQMARPGAEYLGEVRASAAKSHR